MGIPLPFEPLTPPSVRIAGGSRGHLRRERAGVGGGFDLPSFGPAEDPMVPETAAEPLPPTFSEVELAEAAARGREEGRAEAEARVRAEMTGSIEQRTASALEAIAHDLAANRDQNERRLRARAAASGDLALALARAIVPRAMEGRPLADIEVMLVDLVRRLEGQPRLELALAPDLVASGEALLGRIVEDTGHDGEIAMHADHRLTAGDARLSWVDGVALRELSALQREVEAVVEAWLPAEPGAAGPSAPTHPSATARRDDEPEEANRE